MIKEIVIFLILAFFLFVKPVEAAVSFLDLELDENLDKIFVEGIIIPPTGINEPSREGYETTRDFEFTTKSWGENTSSRISLFTQQWYLYSHPETKMFRIENCTSMAIGKRFNVTLGLSINEYGNLEFTPEMPEDLTIKLSLYKNRTLPCIYFYFPYLNPNLVIKNNEKYYPFDDYELIIGFYIPGQPMSNVEIKIPEEFYVKKVSPTPGTNITTYDKNYAFYANKKLENNESKVDIRFSRIPDGGTFIQYCFLLFILPFILLIFLLFGDVRNKTNTGTRGFYWAILPLFIPLITFFPNKPTTFTIFDASLFITFSFLFLLIINDFVKPILDSKGAKILATVIVITLAFIFFLA